MNSQESTEGLAEHQERVLYRQAVDVNAIVVLSKP